MLTIAGLGKPLAEDIVLLRASAKQNITPTAITKPQ